MKKIFPAANSCNAVPALPWRAGGCACDFSENRTLLSPWQNDGCERPIPSHHRIGMQGLRPAPRTSHPMPGVEWRAAAISTNGATNTLPVTCRQKSPPPAAIKISSTTGRSTASSPPSPIMASIRFVVTQSTPERISTVNAIPPTPPRTACHVRLPNDSGACRDGSSASAPSSAPNQRTLLANGIIALSLSSEEARSCLNDPNLRVEIPRRPISVFATSMEQVGGYAPSGPWDPDTSPQYLSRAGACWKGIRHGALRHLLVHLVSGILMAWLTSPQRAMALVVSPFPGLPQHARRSHAPHALRLRDACRFLLRTLRCDTRRPTASRAPGILEHGFNINTTRNPGKHLLPATNIRYPHAMREPISEWQRGALNPKPGKEPSGGIHYRGASWTRQQPTLEIFSRRAKPSSSHRRQPSSATMPRWPATWQRSTSARHSHLGRRLNVNQS